LRNSLLNEEPIMATNENQPAARTTRRDFTKHAAALASITIVPRHVLGGPGRTAPSDKLNIACIGVGGKGYQDLMAVGNEHIVAMCDVDENRAAEGFNRFPDAKRYHDYRKLLHHEQNNIDAVVVATPDHGHIPASVMAMRLGKHVYCEKPLGQNIHEVRLAAQVAKETGVVTQMGNTAHTSYNYRSVVSLVKAGTIGRVNQVHAWCDNEWDDPPRVPARNRRGRDRPKDTPSVPAHLKWNLWLGPAPERPYHPCYHPRHWRGWWDFGNGRLGDMGCHLIDLPFTALDLKYPLTAEAFAAHVHPETAPPWLISKWTFGARGDQPPVELTWYDGNKRPELLKKLTPPKSRFPWYVLLIGTEGMLIAGMDTFKLYPEDKYRGIQRPDLPRKPTHIQDWGEACKANDPMRPGSRFQYAGPLTETVLLGTVAHRAGRKLEWDAKNLEVTNHPDANRFTKRQRCRQGWTL